MCGDESGYPVGASCFQTRPAQSSFVPGNATITHYCVCLVKSPTPLVCAESKGSGGRSD